MFEIEFYETPNGERPVKQFIDKLKTAAETNKAERVRLNKIVSYMDALAQKGTWVGQPVTKHLEGEIWELRPYDDRILYFFVRNNRTFVLLHHFVKKTQKTPSREIETAKRRMADYIERNR
ncbi:MAG: type II toxin-antitoxin system RelE/ParE family toxin [Oscillospiraceae bacterium]|jgi:phage-related protein|nr:type II toxin-antitoxin system RelE/ParE family toxin [Oscillospiraceae bacterium]